MQMHCEAPAPQGSSLASRPFAQHLLILLTAVALTFPCVIYGIPCGHDSLVHANYQHHFSDQFWNGDLYPRWLSGENWGGGSPIFLIQYPLPYFVTALLRPLLGFSEGPRREAMELGVYLFLAMTGAGVTARCWFRSFAAPLPATLAAIAYLALPYFTILVYVRTALGELTALVWMPLLLYGIEKGASCNRGYLTTSAAMALLIASNLLITLLFVPFLTAYAVVLRTEPKGSLSLSRLASSLVLGGAIAGGYLVPVMAFREFFDLAALARALPATEMTRSFLHLSWEVIGLPQTAGGIGACLIMATAAVATAMRSRPDRLSLIVVGATVPLAVFGCAPGLEKIAAVFHVEPPVSRLQALLLGELLLISCFTLLLALTLYWRHPHPGSRQRLWLVVSAICFVAMLRTAAPLWKSLSLLTAVQFPFRLNAILTLVTGGLLASYLQAVLGERAVSRKQMAVWVGTVLAGASAGIALLGAHQSHIARPTVPVMTSSQDFDLMLATYAVGDRPRLERVLAASPMKDCSSSAPEACDARLPQGSGRVEVIGEAPGCLRVTYDCPTSGRLIIRQAYFPLWKRVPADPVYGDVLRPSAEGLLEVPVSSGKRTFRVLFDTGMASQAGAGVTFAGMAGWSLWFWWERRRGKPQREPLNGP